MVIAPFAKGEELDYTTESISLSLEPWLSYPNHDLRSYHLKVMACPSYMAIISTSFPGFPFDSPLLLVRVSRRALRTVGVFHIRLEPPPSQDSFS